MRISFQNIQKPKKIAKAISSVAQGVSLSHIQKQVALISGYRDWHDLEQNHAKTPAVYPAKEMTSAKFLSYFSDQVRDLSNSLNLSWTEALYALSEARLLDAAPLAIDDYESVWLDLFQKFHPILEGKHTPGTVVKTKLSGKRTEHAYIKSYGSAVELLVNSSTNALYADFEIAIPRKPLKPFVPARLKYIYGKWTEADGSEVLFSRDYKPMWRIRNDRRPMRVQPWEWISWVDQQWFWEDATTPWDSLERQQEEEQRIRNYGITALPILADTLPLILFDSRLKKKELDDAVTIMKEEANKNN